MLEQQHRERMRRTGHLNCAHWSIAWGLALREKDNKKNERWQSGANSLSFFESY